MCRGKAATYAHLSKQKLAPDFPALSHTFLRFPMLSRTFLRFPMLSRTSLYFTYIFPALL